MLQRFLIVSCNTTTEIQNNKPTNKQTKQKPAANATDASAATATFAFDIKTKQTLKFPRERPSKQKNKRSRVQNSLQTKKNENEPVVLLS
jgi:hypothetical protein